MSNDATFRGALSSEATTITGPTEVLILRNPKAGRVASRAERVVKCLSQKGMEPTLVDSLDSLSEEIRHRGDLGRLRCVLAIGGDGTVRAVANALEATDHQCRVPIAVLPQGTENLLAKRFGLTSNPSDVADAIGTLRTLTVDVGRVNGELFLIMFSCGFDAEVIERLHRNRRGNISHLSYALPILRSMFGYSFPRMKVRAVAEDGGNVDFSSHWLFAFNLPAYARGIPIAPRADPHDGLFDVCSFHGKSAAIGIFHFATVLLRVNGSWSGCLRQRFTRLTIESVDRVPFQIDGDPGGCLPVKIEMLKDHVSIVLPADGLTRQAG